MCTTLRRVRRVSHLWIVALLVACGTSRTFSGGVYEDAEVRFEVSPPSSDWTAIDVRDSNDLAWHHAGLDAILQANGSCNPRLDIPLSALTNHLLIGFTDRERVDEEILSLAGREALRTHVRARLDGVVRELTFVVVKKNECVYDFAVVAPPGQFPEAVRAFDSLLAGFDAP